jgi:cob(I)alamin adenosyltransferase
MLQSPDSSDLALDNCQSVGDQTRQTQSNMTGREGLVHVYTGDGEGVTLSAAGQALRSVGHGFTVCVIQFFRGCNESRGLRTALANQPSITIKQFGRHGALPREGPEPEDVKLAEEALDAAAEAAASGDYDLVILDQVMLALDSGLIGLHDLLWLVRHRHRSAELILTGCCAPPELIAAADLVTEMRQSKGSPRWGSAVC